MEISPHKKGEGQRDEKPWGKWAGEWQCGRSLGRWGWESGEYAGGSGVWGEGSRLCLQS